MTSVPVLPTAFVAARQAVHAVAEFVLAGVRHGAIGRIGLQPGARGVETAPFGDHHRVVAVDGDELVDRDDDGERRSPITTVRAAAAFFGVEPGIPNKLWTQVSTVGLDDPLVIEPGAVDALAAWFAFVTDALEGLRRDGGADLDPLTLWPEGFDLATAGGGVNFGGSPGDVFIAEPYLYVGPHDRPYPADGGSYWNESFGAALRYDDITSLDQAVAFFTRGFALTSTGR